jgi:protocatechuate 3,4-dioxygenase beta subunit
VLRPVTLTGKVVDANGRPVANALVSAGTARLDGVPNAAFGAEAYTNAAGEYTLRLLDGRDYSISVYP